MNKVKTLSIISIGLLALNLILIWFMLANKHPPHSKEGPKMAIIQKLGFDENQIKEYEKQIAWHRENIRKRDKQMLEIKKQLYTTLITNDTLNIKDSLITEIGKLQVAIESIHYKHFQDIKSICKPEQQKAFENFTLEITNLFPRIKN